MQISKVALTAFMLTVSLLILFPSPEELVIHPAFGLFLSSQLHVSTVDGILLSIVIYRLIGAGCLCGAFLVGGKSVYYSLKGKLLKKVPQRVGPLRPYA